MGAGVERRRAASTQGLSRESAPEPMRSAAPPHNLPAMDAAIRVSGLRRSFGEVEAVAGVDLEVGHGEIFAFLGPNGAGKTTTIEILEGFGQRDAGEVEVLGVDPGRDRDAGVARRAGADRARGDGTVRRSI
jgi:ABC-type uncharacterized transport system ATPase subunit